MWAAQCLPCPILPCTATAAGENARAFAARPDTANPLYEYFVEGIRAKGIRVETGVFGADMKVELLNDGPVTIFLDTDELARPRR